MARHFHHTLQAVASKPYLTLPSTKRLRDNLRIVSLRTVSCFYFRRIRREMGNIVTFIGV